MPRGRPPPDTRGNIKRIELIPSRRSVGTQELPFAALPIDCLHLVLRCIGHRSQAALDMQLFLRLRGRLPPNILPPAPPGVGRARAIAYDLARNCVRRDLPVRFHDLGPALSETICLRQSV